MRYTHATAERDQSIANKLGALMRAADRDEPELRVPVVSI
jgi:hypothetical protein